MKLTFLGTGTSQGIPIIGSDHPVCLSQNPKDKRLRVSVLVSWPSANYVIDCGPDFRQQMLRVGCRHIDGILFTHEHADHTAGLDDIRPFFFKQGPIPIYAHKRVLNNLSQRFDYIFNPQNKYPGTPSVDQIEVMDHHSFNLKGCTVLPISGLHHQLQVFGYRFHNMAYLTDMNFIPDTSLEKLQNLDVLVINALREEPHQSHFTLKEALEIVEKLKPKRAYFTHISHQLGFHEDVEKKLPKNVHLAYDNLSIEI